MNEVPVTGEGARMRPRTAAILAWSSWAIAIGTVVASTLVGVANHSTGGLTGEPGSVAPTIATIAFIVAFATVGALVASKQSANPIGWLLCASSLCFTAGALGVGLANYDGALADVGNWLGSWVWGLGTGLAATFVLLLFPNGALPSRRWRPVAWLACIGIAAFVVGGAFGPSSDPTSVNPYAIGGAVGDVLRFLAGLFQVVLVAAVLSVVSLVFRYRRADRLERQRIKWLLFAGLLFGLSIVAGSLAGSHLRPPAFATNIQNAITAGALALLPIAIGIAVLRYRLYDIEVVINKTVVYGALAAFITAVYVAIVVGIGAAIGHGSSPNLGLSILATAVVAVAFQPVRARVQRFANRLVYGKRATPYEVLSEFSSRMAGMDAADDLLPRMARILAEGTGAIDASVWLHVGGRLEQEADWPNGVGQPARRSLPVSNGPLPPVGGTLTLPVHHQGELLGALALRKPPGDRLTPGEAKLAEDLAAQAGLVLRNVRLIEDLRASRQRIVSAQDAERRRIERNIHDGAQQQLVALAVKLRLAEALLDRDPDGARSMIADLQGNTQSTLEDLRNLARGIYPPLLADQGLAAALESQARKSPIPVTVEARGIGRYSQDVEAAVYFCCLEALQNAAKYSGAASAQISLAEADGYLGFEVRDDGAGFDPAVTPRGSGLTNMADRLEALGGTVRITSARNDGTVVAGRIPVRALEMSG